MLKHILTGQPGLTGSKQNQNGEYQSGASSSGSHKPEHPQQHYATASRAVGPLRASNDVYDSVLHPSMQRSLVRHTVATPSSVHRYPLNHSQSSVNNLSQRLNGVHHSHALNLSILSASKHSVNSASPIAGITDPAATRQFNHQKVIHLQDNRPKVNGGLDISRLDMSRLSRIPSQATPSPAHTVHMLQTPTANPPKQQNQGACSGPLNSSWSTSSLSKYRQRSGQDNSEANQHPQQTGVKEMLTSLGLLCLVSLLLALLSLVFLLKISPLTVTPSSLISPEEYAIVYEVTLALCALALSLNLCCLLVCAIQFLFTVKLVKSSYQGYRTNKYLQKSSISRVCAVGGFFISIPVFLTGMILYTFIQFHSTPAIVTSILIGLGIIFCGCAMVHNVFVWQREKTNAIKALAREQYETMQRQQSQHQQQQQQQQPNRTIVPAMNQGIYAVKDDHNLSLRGAMACAQQPPAAVFNPRQYRRHMVSPPAPLLLATTMHQHQHHHHHHPGNLAGSRVLSSTLPATTASMPTTTTMTTTMSPSTTPGDHSPPSPTAARHRMSQQHLIARENTASVSPGLPAATLDLSSAATTNSPHELSTLV